MEKEARLLAIRKLIQSREIYSQEILLNHLEEMGFNVTQATLSRDLKMLKIGKTPNGKGNYIYHFSDDETTPGNEKSLIEDFMRGFLSIDFSGNFGVISTLPGHADSVAFAVDNLNINEILGTIAGDDTILVIPRNGSTKENIVVSLGKLIPVLKEFF